MNFTDILVIVALLVLFIFSLPHSFKYAVSDFINDLFKTNEFEDKYETKKQKENVFKRERVKKQEIEQELNFNNGYEEDELGYQSFEDEEDDELNYQLFEDEEDDELGYKTFEEEEDDEEFNY